MTLRALCLTLTIAFVPVLATAQTLPEPLSETVSDFAGVLDATQEARIVRLLEETRAETGVQIVVVTMDDIAGYGGAGQRMDAYGKALFNAWGVGGADRDDGLMMLVVTGKREARIALGSGYDAVYDGRAARVLSTAVLPEFLEGRIAEGIEAGVVSSRERLIAPFLAGQPVTLTDGFEEPPPPMSPFLLWLAGAGGIVGLAAFSNMRRARLRRTCPSCSKETLGRTVEVIDAATRSAPGTGIQHMACSACGFNDRKSFTVRAGSKMTSSDEGGSSGGRFFGGAGKRGGGGGSSGGGFGGGNSSGGGAGGKW